jgi:plastocyanin
LPRRALWLLLLGALPRADAVFAQGGTGQVLISLRIDSGKQGKVPAEGAVIWLPSVRDSRAPALAPSVGQRDKQFMPHTLVVRTGAVVGFPNEDRIYHNVFSRSPGGTFDLGLYRDGASKSVRFDRPGLMRVFCNIHPQMAANIMVLGDVAQVATDASGSARIDALPPGRHAVRIWHEMAGEVGAEVVVTAGADARLEMDLKAIALPPPHKNKFGQDYPKSARDPDRY